MTILYACSTDHYGALAGSSDKADSTPQWYLGDGEYIGDGWSGNPQVTIFDNLTPNSPDGEYRFDTPAWGARSGDYALIADGPRLRQTSGGGGNTTRTPASAMRLAIPGASETTRLIHFAFSISALPDTDRQQGHICDFLSTGGSIRASLWVTPTGRLQITDGTLAEVSGTSTITLPDILLTSQSSVIQAQTWHYLSIQIVTNGVDATVDVDIYIGDITEDNLVLTADDVEFTDTNSNPATDNNIDSLGFLAIDFKPRQDQTAGPLRAVRDIVICNNSGSYNNTLLGQVFVSAQDMRDEDAGGGWETEPRENFSVGILDAVTNSTGIRLTNQAAQDIGAQDFTMESMIRFNSFADSAGEYTDIFSRWSDDDANRSYRFYIDGGTASLKFDISTDGTSVTTVKEIPWDIEKWKWYHVAISRWTDTSGSYVSFFVDGVELGVAQVDANTYFAADAALGIGAKYDSGETLDTDTTLDAFLDETRVTIGTGRYDGPFTAPTAKFGRDGGTDPDFADVILLMGYDNAIEDESSAGRTLLLDPTNPVTQLLPDDAAHGYDVLNRRPAWDDTYYEATNYYAESLLTLTALPTDTETVTIGSQTYTFVDTLSSADDVLIGADIEETLINLTAAVNGGTGEGSIYGTGTTANTDAVAVTYQSPQLIFRAMSAGVSTVATTETLANGSFDSPTLSGGTDIPDPSDFQIERLPVDVTGVLGVQATTRVSKSDAGSVSMRFDFVGPSAGVATGDGITVDLNPSWRRQIFEEDPDTSVNFTPSTVIGGRLRLNRLS